jgi:hypothetical protein
MVIGDNFVTGYWWLVMVIMLLAIRDYSINGY